MRRSSRMAWPDIHRNGSLRCPRRELNNQPIDIVLIFCRIGDWYPERSVFQILIALTSGPRFALVYLQYQHQSQGSRTSFWPRILFLIGLIRTLSCGGWVYITSTDDHDAHDVFMILYMVCNLPWMIGGVLFSRKRVIWRRRSDICDF